MATVSDNLGGITNLTLSVYVEKVSQNYLSDKKFILETLENFQTLNKPEVSQICIFASALKDYETDDYLEID